jgi:hypothetical protein
VRRIGREGVRAALARGESIRAWEIRKETVEAVVFLDEEDDVLDAVDVGKPRGRVEVMQGFAREQSPPCAEQELEESTARELRTYIIHKIVERNLLIGSGDSKFDLPQGQTG